MHQKSVRNPSKMRGAPLGENTFPDGPKIEKIRDFERD